MNQFHDGLSGASDAALSSLRIYSPREGEALEAIARRFGITVAALRLANDLPARARAAGGDRDLVIPPAGSSLTGRALATAPAAAAPPAAAARTASAQRAPRSSATGQRAKPTNPKQAARSPRPAAKAAGAQPGKPQVVAQRQASGTQR